MCVCKSGSSGSQLVNIGRFHLRMATKTLDPVILIIYGNKQNILLFGDFTTAE
jgi:hypothetical protein